MTLLNLFFSRFEGGVDVSKHTGCETARQRQLDSKRRQEKLLVLNFLHLHNLLPILRVRPVMKNILR